MKTFQKSQIIDSQFQATQYGVDKEANELVSFCMKSYDGEIMEIPGDYLGTPKNAFYALKTSSGWQEINQGDWIVKTHDDLVVVAQGVFKLFFEEVK
jgi:hypothetical protein